MKKTLKRIWLASCVLFFFPGLSLAQYPYYRNITTQDGLSSNKVYCAVQDHNGFLWFGTDNGLVRYDGANFKTFTVKDGLPDNDVFSVFEDYQNRLWILSFKQAPCYFYNSKLFTVANDTFLSRNFKNTDMYRFALNYASKRILFTAETDANFYAIEKGRMHIKLPKTKFNVNGEAIKIFQSGNTDFLIFRGTVINTRTMHTSSLSADTVLAFTDFNSPQGLKGLGLNLKYGQYSIIQYRGDSLYSQKFSPAKKIVRASGSYTGEVFLLFEDGSICQVNPQNYSLIELKPRVPKGVLSTLFKDNNGGYWACTMDNGIFYFPGNGAEMLETNEDKGANAIGNLSATGEILVGFENRTLHKYNSAGKNQRIIIKQTASENKRITALCSYNKKIVVGGDFGVTVLDENLREFSFKHPSLIHRNIKDIEISPSGTCLAGSAHGAVELDLESKKEIKQIWTRRTTAIAKDKQNNIYLGTINGLFQYNAITQTIHQIITKTELDKSRISDIKIDFLGRIWIGTAQWGLYIMEGKKLTHLNEFGSNCSITSYYVKNIFIDASNIAWISTDKGLNRVSYTSVGHCQTSRITKSLGLPENNINAVWVLHDTIYLATLSGVSRFIYSTTKFSEVPGLEITGIKVNFTTANQNELTNLPYARNNISIEFSAIAFRSADNTSFRYRLKGLDDAWIKTNNNRIDLLSLKPGNYTFEVQAINILTGEMSQIKSVSFKINKPWYATWEFYALIVFLIAGLIFWFTLLKTRRIKRQSQEENERNKQMAELEMQALRSQMNPHFIFNALSAIQNYFVLNKEEAANAYMTKFSRLIRQMLNYSKNNFILLHEELELLNNYLELERMRFENKLQYEITVDKSLNSLDYRLPSLLLQPILENAVNHGIRPSESGGKISLNIYTDNLNLCCKITDTGIGINASKNAKAGSIVAHISKGINILESRIQNLNIMYHTHITIAFKDLSEANPQAHGTEVILEFPLSLVSDFETEI